ncbi:MAG: CbtB-domain containing protein [Methylobacter sp.]|nr:CbtB-domain containing protein [Methylobacter sp.]
MPSNNEPFTHKLSGAPLTKRKSISSSLAYHDDFDKNLYVPLSNTQSKDKTSQELILSAILCCVLGLTLLYAAGFSDIGPLHNAAHDGRHSASFPCH